jgi:hypothetical protein
MGFTYLDGPSPGAITNSRRDARSTLGFASIQQSGDAPEEHVGDLHRRCRRVQDEISRTP